MSKKQEPEPFITGEDRLGPSDTNSGIDEEGAITPEIRVNKKDGDFGFSADIEFLDDVVDAQGNRIEKILGLIRPLLLNLRNGKGDTIKWPEKTRRAQIDSVMRQLEEVEKQ